MEHRPCFQNAVKLWRIRLTAVFALFVLLCAFLVLLFGPPALVLPLVGVPAYGFVLLYYIPAFFRRFQWKIDGGFLWVSSGVWWERSRTIPLDTVQFLIAHRSPLSRQLDVYGASLHLTGGTVWLFALTSGDLERLKGAVS